MAAQSVETVDARASHPQNAEEWIPVSVESMRYAGDQGFELYVRDPTGTSRMRLYRGRNVSLCESDIKHLLERGIQTLYTKSSQAREYSDFLRERVLSDQSMPLTQRYELLTRAARVVFEDAFKQKDVGAICATTSELSEQLTELVNHNDIRLFDLVEVMLHDYSTYAHATRVCSYAILLAQGLGIRDRQTLSQIAEGALLHDVGKIFISEGIIAKNYRITPEERELMRTHPTQGFRRLSVRKDIRWDTLMMIYQHHERIDGCGFPVGLEGDEIHPWARICAVANSCDSLMRDVSTRDPAALKQVRENLSMMSGRSLDEEITQCWLKIFTDQPPQA